MTSTKFCLTRYHQAKLLIKDNLMNEKSTSLSLTQSTQILNFIAVQAISALYLNQSSLHQTVPDWVPITCYTDQSFRFPRENTVLDKAALAKGGLQSRS